MGAELLGTGSILAAFFAGTVALFAPCCIVFLAPSYLAAAVKNNRWRLLPLTLVFAGGLALVLVPITLGVSILAGAIAKYHGPLYWAGGLLMIGLGMLALTGRMWSMPSVLRAPDTTRGDSATFFSLGVFSGIASSCCAPVLVGVMTLSALSGNPAGGLLLGLAFVFGMVIPLLVMALVWDAAHLDRRRWGRAKPVTLRAGTLTVHTNTVNIIVALAFIAMGIGVISLAGSTTMTGNATWFQRAAGAGVTRFAQTVLGWLTPVPDAVLGLGLLALAAVFIWFTLRDRRRPVPPSEAGETDATPDPQADTPSCHASPIDEHTAHRNDVPRN
ncbi:Cytochrome c biogenesis protein CcdA [Raineyella antarctica]|uniref:Cytochrome c biogenesis protein CcdA n=1 Tax=Raineyella antarctica TaxID=1577474 RepID=A0A1G6HKI1_9ACTN|nr:cytochrome c biogenesis CcdA family protein [Raineyella antarctica]SDB94760.1 Cytochrome c biogenesis protein CcdA [Raineyella antarctica]